MAKIKEKKEIDFGKAIVEVVNEEDGKSKKKAVKEITKKTAKKTEESKHKKVVKKVTSRIENKKEKNNNDIINDSTIFKVREKRSRKKQEEISPSLVVDNENNENNVNNEKSEDILVSDDVVLNNIKKEDVFDENDVKEDLLNTDNKSEMFSDEKDVDAIFDDVDRLNVKKNNIKEEKGKDKKEIKQFPKVLFVGVIVVGILIFAIVIASKTMKIVIPNVVAVNNISDLNNKLGVAIVPPKEVKNIQYGIEGDGIARMDYVRNSQNGSMNLVFRMTKDPDKDLYGESYRWGERIIHIDVECDDGEIINVTSYEALDDNLVLIALWKDNNEYYSLFTKNMSIKEDFYKEVNQIVSANHKSQ